MRWGGYWISLIPYRMVWMRCSGVVKAVLDTSWQRALPKRMAAFNS